ncbi:hypothetical protein JHL18_21760 [Clostridium sp. YIM B02505]|uniref:Uncharacterized protein n=1 Tax=Clostridium yunnanense TaxID=2800325 RepID=A0ABS1EV33_9CLOT|nr:hypothetical protein [Clostridium yunnanense]MBK1813252.1 hypothetical protein [Clostridium yunnanense]
MKSYRLGFSLKGFVAFMVVMIPNIVWIIAPPVNDPIAGNNALYPIIDILLVASQVIMIALLIIIIPNENMNSKSIKIYFKLACLCLLGYYVSWFCYYTGMVYPLMLVGMAVLPSIYFILIELWLKNYIAIIPSIIFGITHIAITCSNYIS